MGLLSIGNNANPSLRYKDGLIKEADINNDGTKESFYARYIIDMNNCDVETSGQSATMSCPGEKTEQDDFQSLSIHYTQADGSTRGLGVRMDSTPETRIFVAHAEGFTAALATNKPEFTVGETVTLSDGRSASIKEFLFQVDYATLNVTNISARVYVDRESVDVSLADISRIENN
jgi:hypothetical protein